MRTDETICLNSLVNGKQPYIEDRIYYGGGHLRRHHRLILKLRMLGAI